MIAELRQTLAAAIETRLGDPTVNVDAAPPEALVPPAIAVDLDSANPNGRILDDVVLSVTVVPFAELASPEFADERDRYVEAVLAVFHTLKLEDAGLGDWTGVTRDVQLGGVTHRAFEFTLPITTPSVCI